MSKKEISSGAEKAENLTRKKSNTKANKAKKNTKPAVKNTANKKPEKTAAKAEKKVIHHADIEIKSGKEAEKAERARAEKTQSR